jgi:hypothetical protein
MKKITFFFLVCLPVVSFSQANIGTINSGALIATNSSGTLGEIIVIPQTQNLTGQTGILGILVELKDGTQLSNNQFELTSSITVYPNPTNSTLFFETKEKIEGEKMAVYNSSGRMVYNGALNSEKTINFETLPVGIYLIEFENKKIKPFKIIKQ